MEEPLPFSRVELLTSERIVRVSRTVQVQAIGILARHTPQEMVAVLCGAIRGPEAREE